MSSLPKRVERVSTSWATAWVVLVAGSSGVRGCQREKERKQSKWTENLHRVASLGLIIHVHKFLLLHCGESVESSLPRVLLAWKISSAEPLVLIRTSNRPVVFRVIVNILRGTRNVFAQWLEMEQRVEFIVNNLSIKCGGGFDEI